MRPDLELEDCIERLSRLSHYSREEYAALEELLGAEHLRRRLNGQLDLYLRHRRGEGFELARWESRLFRHVVRAGLWSTGLLGRARRNARTPVVVEREIRLSALPEAFEGFRLLQLSDFHFEFIPELPEILKEMLRDLTFDLCVITGDFRGETVGPYEESLEHLERCREAMGEPVAAVLGNHDNVELALRLPACGVRCLMNEGMEIRRGNAALWLAGIDDPHHYRTHDFEALRSGSGSPAVSILLSHSPESCREAEAAGFDVMLSGHTHGGQICLPGGAPVLGHIRGMPRALIRGEWRCGRLQGYTSRGVGCSSLDARLNCPPELTVHILRGAGGSGSS